MNNLLSLSAAQLNRAANLKEKLEELQRELASLLGASSSVAPNRGPGRPRKEITFVAAEPPVQKRRKMSAAARAKMAAAAKARWAEAKAAGKSSL
jgi:hypothetical protein